MPHDPSDPLRTSAAEKEEDVLRSHILTLPQPATTKHPAASSVEFRFVRIFSGAPLG